MIKRTLAPVSHVLFRLLCIFLLLSNGCGVEEFEDRRWTPDFAVELDADSVEAQLLAATHGFQLIREISDIKVFHFKHPKACADHHCKFHAKHLVDRLMNDSIVKRVEQQYILERDKRSLSVEHLDRDFDTLSDQTFKRAADFIYEKNLISRNEKLDPNFNDPLFGKQWHLNNVGQFANPGLDMNVLPAWQKGFKGNGTAVVVVDDGIDTKHPDIRDNFNPFISADLNDPLDINGNPRSSKTLIPSDEGHGTQCAGEIAAKANNYVCGTGVAPEASLGGVRILAGRITDLLESYSILHQNQDVDIYSCSWGPKDNGKKMEMPHYYTGRALRYSATKGRKGLGNLFFYASGNGGKNGDNCGPDGYVNSPYTMPMSAVNVYGRSVAYGERCSATFATVPVGGWPAEDAGGPHRSFPRITTSKINSRCTTRFMGTSAAAPLGAGCMAIVLQGNRNLTWRDAQHVMARSCRIPNPVQLVWQRNGAGFHVSHHFGFGLLDCSKALKIAQTWKNVGKRLRCVSKIFSGRKRMHAKSKTSFRLRLTDCQDQNNKGSVNHIEHVTVSFVIKHDLRGDVQLWLTSPMGTVSRLLGARWPDKSRKGIKHTFLTRFLLGENPLGVWTVRIEDTGRRKTRRHRRGIIQKVTMEIFGTEDAPSGLTKPHRSRKISARETKRTFEIERQESLKIFPLHQDVLDIKREMEETGKSGDNFDFAKLDGRIKGLREKSVAEEDIKSLYDKINTPIAKK